MLDGATGQALLFLQLGQFPLREHGVALPLGQRGDLQRQQAFFGLELLPLQLFVVLLLPQGPGHRRIFLVEDQVAVDAVALLNRPLEGKIILRGHICTTSPSQRVTEPCF